MRDLEHFKPYGLNPRGLLTVSEAGEIIEQVKHLQVKFEAETPQRQIELIAMRMYCAGRSAAIVKPSALALAVELSGALTEVAANPIGASRLAQLLHCTPAELQYKVTALSNLVESVPEG